MQKERSKLSAIDELIGHFDRAVRTLHPGATQARRPSPSAAKPLDSQPANRTVRSHHAGLMRINHTGEVCAQALYSGQSLTAKNSDVRDEMLASAKEEEDHLAWCEHRLKELDSHTSYLNPLFYMGSFTMGALAGLISDSFSLGFIAATEDRVCAHLRAHLDDLPEDDERSRAILEQMIIDEERHGQKALDAGGTEFSESQKNLMMMLSKVMTSSTYRI